MRRALGLTTARRLWTIVFLGVFTLGAIVLECIAGLWHPAGWTIPWTEYLARYVPWPVQLAAYVILVVWLPIHFWRHDHLREVARQRGYMQSVKDLGSRLAETHTEDTLYKVLRGLEHAGVRGQAATGAISAMQNEGILFRERA